MSKPVLAPDEAVDLLRQVLRRYYSRLLRAHPPIRFELLLASDVKEYGCYSSSKTAVTKPEERAGQRSCPDVRITLDADEWAAVKSEKAREAILARSVHGVRPKWLRETADEVIVDQYNRPVIKLRKPDLVMSGYADVAATFGAYSRETVSLQTCQVMIDKARPLPFMGEIDVTAGEWPSSADDVSCHDPDAEARAMLNEEFAPPADDHDQVVEETTLPEGIPVGEQADERMDDGPELDDEPPAPNLADESDADVKEFPVLCGECRKVHVSSQLDEYGYCAFCSKPAPNLADEQTGRGLGPFPTFAAMFEEQPKPSDPVDLMLRIAIGDTIPLARLNTLKDRGAIDNQIRDELVVCWGFHNDHDEPRTYNGYTTRGGKKPAFWHGETRSDHGLFRTPDLQGPALINRVRKITGIPLSKQRTADRPATSPAPEDDENCGVFVIKGHKGTTKGYVDAPGLKAAVKYATLTFGMGLKVELAEECPGSGYTVAECDSEGKLVGVAPRREPAAKPKRTRKPSTKPEARP